ncbi:HEAT repeat domain-containing protein [Meiothermus hypogaeus]|nr:HEAT repeat domain-containing protein [Meiothermus hypogaeus]RIH76450.1 Leucine rich repeat variant [Meiothermus hypogaeus]
MKALLEEAQNPQTPPERLRALASRPEAEIRRAVAANPNTPEAVLWRLAVHFPEAVLGNPVLDLFLLVNANWLAELPGYARLRLLGSPEASSHFLRWAVREGDYGAVLSVLRNPQAPLELVEALTDHALPGVTEAARLHVGFESEPLEAALGWCEVDMDYLELRQMVLLGMTPAWLAPRLALEPDPSLRLALLEQADLPKAVLEAFLLDEEETVRKAARQHPATPHQTLNWVERLEAGLPVEMPLETLVQATPWVRALVARHPQTPPSLLERLTTDDDWRVRIAAAGNPGLPAAWLETLAQDGDREVRQAVAANPRCPAGLLERLLADESEEVRQAAAQNPALPSQMRWFLEQLQSHDARFSPQELQRLAALGAHTRRLALAHPLAPVQLLHHYHTDPDWLARLAVARHPHTPAATLAAMAADTDPDVRQAVAVHPFTPPESLQALAHDEQPDVRAQVAQNPQTPLPVVLQLAQDGHWRVRQAVAARPSTPAEVLYQLAQDPDRDVRQAVADHPRVPEGALRLLLEGLELQVEMGLVEFCRRAKHAEPLPPALLDRLAQGNEWARRLAALHPSTPVHTQGVLAQDPDWRVRQALASNPGVDRDLLFLLSQDPDADVRRAVLMHPQVTAEILGRLANDDPQDIRLRVAEHPLTPVPALHRLLADPDEQVRQAAQAHPRAPADLVAQYRRAEALDPGLEGRFLQQLAQQGVWGRTLAAQNPATPPSTLQDLLYDGEWTVRQALARNPALGPETLAILAQDADRDVHQAVAQHPQTPQATLGVLLRDVDENVRLAALQNPHLDPQTLAAYRTRLALAASRSPFALNRAVALAGPHIPAQELSKVRHWSAPEWLVRYAVAQNPNTPATVLERLAQDGNRLVRKKALEALGLRLDGQRP